MKVKKIVFYLYGVKLTRTEFVALRKRLSSRFQFLINEPWHHDVTYSPKHRTLTFKFAPMGRNLYPDESSESHPFTLGNPVSIDSIHRDRVSDFISGYFFAKESR